MKHNYTTYALFLLLWCFIWWWAWFLTPETLLSWIVPFLCLLWIYYLWVSWEYRWTKWIFSFFLIWVFALSIEFIGTKTCFPYGCFEYNTKLGPHLWAIPVLLFFIWPIIVFSITGVASIFSRSRKHRIFMSLLLLIILDLALDPVHVAQWIRSYKYTLWRFWVPISNFMWRLFSGLISILFLFAIVKPNQKNYPLSYTIWGIIMLWYFWGLFAVLLY